MEYLLHRILFPLLLTHMQTFTLTPTTENDLSLQEEHTSGSMWAQVPSSRTLFYNVSALLK